MVQCYFTTLGSGGPQWLYNLTLPPTHPARTNRLKFNYLSNQIEYRYQILKKERWKKRKKERTKERKNEKRKEGEKGKKEREGKDGKNEKGQKVKVKS